MKRMLFNATHQEELRVAIVDGQKLIDLDIETAGREQRKGNIYKGVITRIEPGLEACFVNYGEDRHGFLPFKEVARSYFKEGVDVRSARIQDALKEGQELIVQVEKEERGNKGAALTTFISLAGRYLVLMPNNPRGGGVSRRIEGEDRQELREAMDQLDVPQGMSIIARTAGIGRSADELQWDLSYLMQLWNAIDGAAKANAAPILIYLESSLVIRAIRDYFSPDIGEILIDTDDIADQATAFMSVVMPDNVQRVKRYRDDVPLFSRFQIEHQIETAYSRHVDLPSGGSIVIDHTEALVAIDVNSARSTRGADIEETAVRTNLEAAEEAARQLRLRDLGGLIVIDFIDMEDNRNQRAVEQQLRDSLHVDRARVQMGKISRFGLIELSRQRLRPALSEGSHITCPRCNGTGVIRDAESSALHVLRLLQEEAMKENTAAVHAQVPVEVATFLLNEKRADITKIEARLKVNLMLIPNKHIETPHHIIERLRHDDPRLEDVKASFELIDAPATNLAWAPKEQELKAKPEALVKGVTPSQPAPPSSAPKASRSAAPQTAEAVPSAGILKKLSTWLAGIFGSSTDQTDQSKAAAEKTDRRPGDRRTNGSGAGRSRRGRPDQRRNDNQGQTAAQADKPAQRPEQPATDESTSENGATRARRGRRGRGRTRNGQTEAGSSDQDLLESQAHVAESDSALNNENPQTDVSATPDVDHEQTQETGDKPRRRSRRGRRGRRPDEASTDSVTSSEGDSDLAAAHAETAPAVSTAQTERAEPQPIAVAPVNEAISASETANQAQPAAQPATHQVHEQPALQAQQAPIVQVQEVLVKEVLVHEEVTPAAVAQEPKQESLLQSIIAPAQEPATIAVAAPVADPSPIVVPSSLAPTVDKATLHALVQQAGLQWIESDPTRVSQVQQSITAQPVKRLGREPKPVAVVSNAALVQVETRR